MMTKAEAIALLGREVPASQPPVLDAADLDDLVAFMAVKDELGLWPSEVGWGETYDATLLNFAAAKAWDRKAGRVANLVTYTADGATINAGALHEQCLRMKRSYLARCAGSAATAARTR